MKQFAVVGMLALAGVLPSLPVSAQNTIECRSQRGQQSECRVPWSRSELVQQIGNQVCIPDTTWGQSPGRVWVNQGCSASFREARGPGPNYGDRDDDRWDDRDHDRDDDRYGDREQIACRSERHRRQECRTNNWREARLVRQISDTRCEENRNWGMRRDILWVDLGCSAVFAQADRGPGGPGHSWGGGPGSQVECNSQGNRYRECPVGNNWRGAELVRQSSEAACVEGRTWGYGRGVLWVDRGCAGVFAASRGNSYSGGRSLSCNSRNNRRQECPAGGWRNAQLLRQTSRASCVENQTWGFVRGAVWVDRGCAGEFGEARR